MMKRLVLIAAALFIGSSVAQAQIIAGCAIATSATIGCVRPDNSTITISNGVLSAVGGGGSGTVTSVSVTTANGISGSVATPTTTPAITLTLGAITPTTVTIGSGAAITSSGAGGALGTAAFASTGTSGATVPLLNGANTFSGNTVVSGAQFGLSGGLAIPDWTGTTSTGTGARYNNVAGTINNTTGTGTTAFGATDLFGGNTLTATGAMTVTNYYAMYVRNPVCSTNFTCTSSYALGADSLAVLPPSNTTAVKVSGGSITGSSTVSPGISVTGTLNTTGVVDGAVLSANITNTASGSSTMLVDLQVGGSSKFKVGVDGTIYGDGFFALKAAGSPGELQAFTYALNNNVGIGALWFDIGAFGDTYLQRDNTGIAAIRAGTQAQTLRVYNTYTDSTHFEAAQLDWQGTSNVLSIGTIAGSGGGSARNMQFVVGGANKLDYGVTTASTWTSSAPFAGSSTIKAGSHILATSAAPSISACGTGTPTVAGSDSFGSVTAGSAATTCVVNFGTTWGAAPSCTVSSGTAISSLTVGTSTTQLTISGSALGGDTISWVCGSTASLSTRRRYAANDNIDSVAFQGNRLHA